MVFKVLYYTRSYQKMLTHLISLLSLPTIALGAQQVPLIDPISSPFTANFDELVTRNLDRWRTPGLAIAVVHGEDIFSKVWTPLPKARGSIDGTRQRRVFFEWPKFLLECNVCLAGLIVWISRDSRCISLKFSGTT